MYNLYCYQVMYVVESAALTLGVRPSLQLLRPAMAACSLNGGHREAEQVSPASAGHLRTGSKEARELKGCQCHGVCLFALVAAGMFGFIIALSFGSSYLSPLLPFAFLSFSHFFFFRLACSLCSLLSRSVWVSTWP